MNKARIQKQVNLKFDLIVAGGGMAGVCASIAAARHGLKVALVQDRPVLGGTGSSEIRVWMLGATSHMGNNNRWAREGGIVGEILEENTFRNKEGNPVLFDMVLIDKVTEEKNISLFLNTTVFAIDKSEEHKISSIKAYCSSSETIYEMSAGLFCDATGDGLLGYLGGADYRTGAETVEETGEPFAKYSTSPGECLGSSILLYVKKTEHPVKYTAPSFSMTAKEVEDRIIRIRNTEYFDPEHKDGCKYWWIEYGGEKDTIHDNEEIKYTLWRVVYGIWDYIKNSGKYPGSEKFTLEWAGLIPGKRESRRFMGDYVLSQKDIVGQVPHYDDVAFGGWAIDLHPAKGVFAKSGNACTQWHSKGVYGIPYRCYYSRNIDNLFIAGRLISTTHVAMGSTRVMLTGGIGGEVIGTAAAICMKQACLPSDISHKDKIRELQAQLVSNGNYIPDKDIRIPGNLIENAGIEVSSEFEISSLSRGKGVWRPLEHPVAQMIPAKEGKFPSITFRVKADEITELNVQLRSSSKVRNHTPDTILSEKVIAVPSGETSITLDFDSSCKQNRYMFICFGAAQGVQLLFSEFRCTGILSVFNKIMPAVSNWGKQVPPPDTGFDSFEFWCPERRPDGYNVALDMLPAIRPFGPDNLRNTVFRPVTGQEAWVADPSDSSPAIKVRWKHNVDISSITLYLDTDFDHPMETVQWGHPESNMPFCADSISIANSKGELIAKRENNHNSVVRLDLEKSIQTDMIEIMLNNSSGFPVSVFGLSIN